MGNNLHISYDLKQPGRDYGSVIAKIKELGPWARIHDSFWYVNSAYSPQQAVNHVLAVMDASDTIYVVDATNNTAWWHNVSDEAANLIRNQWSK